MNNIIINISVTIASFGIGFLILKIWFEKYLKSYFDNNFEKKKVHLELKKDIISKREDKRIEIYNEVIELLYRNRNNYRYIFSLLCSYVDSMGYEGYEKYLETGDKILTIKEIRKKIEIIIKEKTDFIANKVEEGLYKNVTYLDPCFVHVHQTKHAYRAFNRLLNEFIFSSSIQDIERNEPILRELYDQYIKIDNYYQLTKEYITNYINDIKI